MGHPIQHFAPGLRLLAQDVDLHVYYWDAATDGLFDPGFGRHVRWSADLHSGYHWWSPPAGSGWRRHLALLRQLRRDRPEAVLCFGWRTPAARTAIAFAALSGVPLLYYGDTNPFASLGRGRGILRSLVLRRLFRSAGAVSTGTFNREFYVRHGMAPDRIHPGVYPTDVDRFRAAAEDRPGPAPDGRRERPLVIGFCGKFTAIKGVADLVEAAAALPRERAWQLWLIGDGPLRPQIESLLAERGLADRTRLLGFRNTDELPGLFAAIDIMVMPSRREPRGLVAIEALAAGAAVVVSSATGLWGRGDVIDNGRTGLVFPVGDTDALAAMLRNLLDDAPLRQRLAAAGQAESASFGPADFATTAATALLSATRVSPTRISPARKDDQ
jgi:glycosyltransferase involved in cell wall biosynthesis